MPRRLDEWFPVSCEIQLVTPLLTSLRSDVLRREVRVVWVAWAGATMRTPENCNKLVS
jgi:hypothetical protein